MKSRHFGEFSDIGHFLGLHFSGFGLNKTKSCYLYFMLDIKSSTCFNLLKLGFWEVGHDVVSCTNFGELGVVYEAGFCLNLGQTQLGVVCKLESTQVERRILELI